jgi:hypothetical protein
MVKWNASRSLRLNGTGSPSAQTHPDQHTRTLELLLHVSRRHERAPPRDPERQHCVVDLTNELAHGRNGEGVGRAYGVLHGVRPVRVPFVVRLRGGLGRELGDDGDGGGDFSVDSGEVRLSNWVYQPGSCTLWMRDLHSGRGVEWIRESFAWTERAEGCQFDPSEEGGRAPPVEVVDEIADLLFHGQLEP